jgi:hypothetical protein
MAPLAGTIPLPNWGIYLISFMFSSSRCKRHEATQDGIGVVLDDGQITHALPFAVSGSPQLKIFGRSILTFFSRARFAQAREQNLIPPSRPRSYPRLVM